MLIKVLLIFTWLICHPILYCDQATSTSEQCLIHKKTTLCSQAALAVLNCDGNPENVLKALASEENLKSLLSATLKGGAVNLLLDKLGSNGMANTFMSKGAVNTIGAGLDKLIMNKPLDQGIKDGWINAGIDTVAQVCANKIGELYKPDVIKPNGLKTDGGYNLKTDGVYNAESINYATHKVLHGALGASFGAGLAMISNTDPRLGAVSGLFGAVLSEMMAEGFAPEMADVEQYAKDHPGTDPESLRSHFMAQAQNTANWSAFAGAVGSFGLELDVNTAHRTGKNAVDNNFLPGIFLAIMVATIFEYPQYLRDCETDKLHVALGKMGIEVAKDVMLGGIVFKVSGAVCKTFKEAAAAVVAQNPMLKGAITALESKFGKIEQYFVEKFNNQKILGGEKPKVNNELTHRIGGSKIPDQQFGKVNLDPKNSHAHELYKQELQKLDLTHGFTTQERNAVMQQLQEMQTGKIEIMAGHGGKRPIRDLSGVEDRYGPGIWSKIKSKTNFTKLDGDTIELHGYKNVTTGEVFGLKIKKQ